HGNSRERLAQMPLQTPAPHAGRLRQCRRIEAARVHEILERTGGAAAHTLQRIARELLEVLNGRSRDELFCLPAPTRHQRDSTVGAPRIHALALPVERRVALLRHVFDTHQTTVRCMKPVEKRPDSGTRHRMRSPRFRRPLPYRSLSIRYIDAEPVLPRVSR